MEPSTAQTFQDWATGAAAVATAVAIVVGGGWALWRYVLPAPFAPNWETVVRDCSVRRLSSGRYIYIANVVVTNMSNTPFFIDRVLLGIFYPPEEVQEDNLLALSESDRLIEAEVSESFPPQTPKTLHAVDEGVESLYHAVVLAWKLYYQRPRWAGIFGRRPETRSGAMYVPVDAQSLTLYTESGTQGS